MPSPDPVPTLLQLMFGESAPAALLLDSPRLMLWARAFDEWLEECKRVQHKRSHVNILNNWKSFFNLVAIPPWAVTPLDIERYRDCLVDQGKSAGTIRYIFWSIGKFYKWCSQRGIDPQCGPSFNPVSGISTPVPNPGPPMLGSDEAAALLELLKADSCLLSRRDYAFFLARLRLGVSLKSLRELRWGDIQVKDGRAWVVWSSHLPASPLPEDVWQAILDYLQASGRLGQARPGGMPPAAYIFTPLANLFGQGATGLAEDWDEGRFVSTSHLYDILKIYGGLAGIQAVKLTLPKSKVWRCRSPATA
jgi:integrase